MVIFVVRLFLSLCREMSQKALSIAFGLIVGGALLDAQAHETALEEITISDTDPSVLDKVYVWGRSMVQIGKADAASEGMVGYADFELRPLSRVGELVEVVPGMIATQHSGGGKANQYFLRGFNLDHGTDFAGIYDGIPLNLRSHAHMSGYLDINFIIPELVETVGFQKGVHYAGNGDYSAAGAARFSTYDRLETGFAEINLTDEGDYRLLIADTIDLDEDNSLLAAFNLEGGDGPFDRAEQLTKYQGVLKYTRAMGDKVFRASVLGYDSDWYATDQVPLRAVEQGLIGRFGTLDPDLGGDTHRVIASAGLEWDQASVLGYVQSYGLNLYGNPTFYLDQVNGDQFVQKDKRIILGTRGDIARDLVVAGLKTSLRAGGGLQYDDIDQVGLLTTQQRQVTGTIRDDSLGLMAVDVWSDVTLHLTDRLRVTAGGRFDLLDYDVVSNIPENSGDGSDTTFSPKGSIAWRVTDTIELYAGYGRGFHSNDVRGGVLQLDPATLSPTDPVDVFVEAKGGEIGVRYEPSSRMNISASYFQLDMDSELIFVGDAGTSEPSDATTRDGVEVSLFWQPMDAVVLDAQGAWATARFDGVASGQDHVPNSVGFAGSVGATWVGPENWSASLRWRHLGQAALIEDNSVRSDPTNLVNLGVEKQIGRFRIGVDVLNLLDSEDNDITFFYESQLLGEEGPVEDIHFHPVHPRSFKLVLRASF